MFKLGQLHQYITGAAHMGLLQASVFGAFRFGLSVFR
jgi:hypothetical protein